MNWSAIASIVFLTAQGSALADQPINDQARGELAKALQIHGCSGGEMEFDGKKFEVDNAICREGRKYSLKFDQSFTLIKMEVAKERESGRSVTEQERTKLAEAVTAQGCSGGKMEFEDERFEVEDATCSDGKSHDLKFDGSFRLLKKD